MRYRLTLINPVLVVPDPVSEGQATPPIAVSVVETDFEQTGQVLNTLIFGGCIPMHKRNRDSELTPVVPYEISLYIPESNIAGIQDLEP